MLAELINGFLDRYEEAKKDRRQLADDALRAVSHALNETEIYYARRERGAPRSEETELQLARYWSAAAIPLRHIDLGFSEACEHKSRYWLNPDAWDEKMLARHKIQLTQVTKRVRELRGFRAAPSLGSRRKSA
jgi:hypothetical protein